MKTFLCTVIVFLSILLVTSWKSSKQEGTKFTIIRTTDSDDEYIYTISVNDSVVHRLMNSDEIMDIICPKCYEIEEQ